MPAVSTCPRQNILKRRVAERRPFFSHGATQVPRGAALFSERFGPARTCRPSRRLRIATALSQATPKLYAAPRRSCAVSSQPAPAPTPSMKLLDTKVPGCRKLRRSSRRLQRIQAQGRPPGPEPPATVRGRGCGTGFFGFLEAAVLAQAGSSALLEQFAVAPRYRDPVRAEAQGLPSPLPR